MESVAFIQWCLDHLNYWVAGEMKRGQEIFGVGVIDVDNHDCMTLGAIQTPDAKSLEGMDYNLSLIHI